MKNAYKAAILLLLALLIAQAQSSTKFTYSFPFNGTAGALYNSEYAPVYQLGTLSVNSTLKITVTLPNNGDISLFGYLVTFVNAGNGLKYIDNTGASPALMPAVDAAGNAVVLPAATSATTYTYTYTIYFPTSFTATSANFVLVMGFDAFQYSKFVYYTVEAISYPPNTLITVGSASTGVTLLKAVEIFRSSEAKLIYVSQPGEVFNFTVYPAAVCTTGAGAACTENYVVGYYPITTTASTATYGFNGNGLTLGTKVPLTSTETTASATVYPGNTAHYSNNFTTTGYYLLSFILSYSSFTDATLSFYSDSYACPYTSGYADFYTTFPGCTTPKANSGLPCMVYDPNLAICSQCVQGYVLTNGACIANTTCPARQYFSYGVCVNVSSLCGAFDSFTGACLNCSDPVNYDFNNGSCIRKAVTCAANQWQTNYTCYNASITCATFDPNTGKCLTCLSNLYQLNTDGSCTLIVVNCPQGQYAVGLNCVTIPVECLNFDRAIGKCLSCIKGFFVEGGVCKRIVCPDGQVPSGYGIFCVNVSPLCDVYDSLTGDCLSCKQKGYTVREGRCVQISSGLAGCAEREAVGFGPCVGADLNCQTFNLITGNCDECKSGFFLDFTGHCSLSAKCGAGQWSVNGECLAFPDNC